MTLMIQMLVYLHIFSENFKEVMTASERLKFGEVYANCEAEEVVNGYHAGWRESGLGR